MRREERQGKKKGCTNRKRREMRGGNRETGDRQKDKTEWERDKRWGRQTRDGEREGRN